MTQSRMFIAPLKTQYAAFSSHLPMPSLQFGKLECEKRPVQAGEKCTGTKRCPRAEKKATHPAGAARIRAPKRNAPVKKIGRAHV